MTKIWSHIADVTSSTIAAETRISSSECRWDTSSSTPRITECASSSTGGVSGKARPDASNSDMWLMIWLRTPPQSRS